MGLPESLLAMFLVGLAGGVHCVGMCGAIVATFAGAGPAARPAQALAYNAGRITSYAIAGALVGAIGSLARYADAILPAQQILYAVAAATLVLVGFALAGATRVLGPLERAGAVVWQRIRPLTRGVLPASTPLRAYALGGLWGWVPCGLVYGALATALAAGDWRRGALLMAAFGAGTLPLMLGSGLAAAKLVRTPRARRVLGVTVVVLGVAGLAHLAGSSGLVAHAIALCFGSGRG